MVVHEFTRIIRLIEAECSIRGSGSRTAPPFEGMVGEFANWLKPETGVVKAMVEVT